ncbi:hypothetical protein PTKIN_Ptkin08bG0161800 [Pterospermum kingtungense]
MGQAIHEICFQNVSFGIQVHKLPFEMITVKNAERKGHIFGKLEEVEDPGWVSGIDFCFNYGKLGNVIRFCVDNNVGDLSSDQRRMFGLWMKVAPFRNKKEGRPFKRNGGVEGCFEDRVEEETKWGFGRSRGKEGGDGLFRVQVDRGKDSFLDRAEVRRGMDNNEGCEANEIFKGFADKNGISTKLVGNGERVGNMNDYNGARDIGDRENVNPNSGRMNNENQEEEILLWECGEVV